LNEAAPLDDWSTLLSRFHNVKGIITELKLTIDQLSSNFESAKSLILKLARKMDEVGLCERNEICSTIKDLLKDKIKEGKITPKWIEKCLPEDYKRKYAKSEESSHLRKRVLQEIQVGNKGRVQTALAAHEEIGKGKCPRCLELEEVVSKTSRIQTAENMSQSEVRIPISKDKYEQIVSVMERSSDLFYIVVDRTSWSFVNAE
jgi:hypothetical protein